MAFDINNKDELQKCVEAGEKFKELENNQIYQLIEDRVLKPLERASFQSFGNVMATDTQAIINCQIRKKAVDLFREQWRVVINEGTVARQKLEGKFDNESGLSDY